MRDVITIEDGRITGCSDHFQPRLDATTVMDESVIGPMTVGGGTAKSCETCGTAVIIPECKTRPRRWPCADWTPIVAPAPAADERVVKVRQYLAGFDAFHSIQNSNEMIRALLAVVEEMRGHLDGDKRKMYGIIKNLEQERDAADVTLAEVMEDRDLRIVALDKMKQQRDTACIHRADSQDRVKELEAEVDKYIGIAAVADRGMFRKAVKVIELEAEVKSQLVTAKELDDARCARIAELEAELKSERREHAEWQGQSDRWEELYQKECEKRQDDLVQRGKQVKGWITDIELKNFDDGCSFRTILITNREMSWQGKESNNIPVTLTIEEGK